jgi:catechol 2,3-dioxygenase-like lactoylglutathione lyase family enzyme
MQRFNGICILSPQVERLADFYHHVLGVDYQRDGDNFAFFTQGAELSIFSWQGIEQMVPGCMTGAGCGGYTLEFEVEDVDQQHERMIAMGVPVVKPPVTYPWGRRSAWFRDPDGNILNFFSPTTKSG